MSIEEDTPDNNGQVADEIGEAGNKSEKPRSRFGNVETYKKILLGNLSHIFKYIQFFH